MKKVKSHESNGIYDEIGESVVRGFARLVVGLVSHGANVDSGKSLRLAKRPRLALSVLERLFSKLTLGQGGDISPSPEATDALPLAKLRKGALDLMITKGAQRDTVINDTANRTQGNGGNVQKSPIQKLNTASAITSALPMSIATAVTVKALSSESVSPKRHVKLVPQFKDRIRNLIY